jgi:hypothetical protein
MWWWYRTLAITIVRYYDAIKCLWLQLLTLCFATSQYEMSYDLCFDANRCYDAIKCFVIAIVDFVLSPQVNMKMNDAILCLWSTLWKIVKLTGLSMILASYYGINLLKFARTMTAWAPYIWGDCTHCYVLRCLCENKTEIRVRLTSLNATPPK